MKNLQNTCLRLSMSSSLEFNPVTAVSFVMQMHPWGGELPFHMEEMRSSSTRESRTPICLPILVSLSLTVVSKEKRSIKKASFDRIECLNLIAINLDTKYSIDSYLAVFFRI